ncbi:MAG: hypothetical protein R3F43_22185 [bacterium]
MQSPLIQTPREGAVHDLFERLLPALDPPAGPLPDAEGVAALIEGRLGPAEQARLLDAIRQSPAARVELRALAPERYRSLLGEEVTTTAPGKVLTFPGRRIALAVAGAALAAAAALVLLPAAPPEGAGVAVSAQSAIRSHGVAEPGDSFHLMMRLGTPGLLARLRGAEAWGALIQTDAQGTRLVCTSADARCRASADTLAWRFVAPLKPGVTGFAFVSASTVPDADRLDAYLRPPAGRRR